MPSRVWSHICDYAALQATGNAIIIGEFDRMYTPAVPFNTHLFFIVDKWLGLPLETFTHQIRIITPNHQLLWVSPLDNLTIKPDGSGTGTHAIVNAIMNKVFPELGEYAIELLINNIPVHIMPLTVLPSSMQPDLRAPQY